ncbi:MAG: hypothetical protein OHK93_006053 [Ramalina farinacea]|uniref:Poly [ADP-ribose] polymerase n=1 Tax=Ramalina farinacea TaxID=258253 RepID=A0AA43QKV0_9LECA|nr:hypothetical protein [Ramalina farinacea]
MPPKKRKGSGKQAETQSKQPKQEGQKAVSHDVNIPLDEGFHDDPTAKVFIDDGIIFDASLNQTNIGGNNNKDAKGGKFYTHTRWGRVGEFGSSKQFGPSDFDSAFKEFNKKFKDKSGHKWEDRAEPAKKGKYTFLEKNYESDDEDDDADDKVKKEVKEEDEEPEVESKLPRPTQRLVELIFNQNHFNAVLENIGYNANKLPLGKLSKGTLKQGFEHLHELAGLIKHPKLAGDKYGTSQEEAIEDFSNKYYSTIPHEFGRSRPPAINNNELLRAEISMLDTLTDMEVANTIMKSTSDKSKDAESVNMLDKRFEELKLDEVTALDHKSSEYKALSNYLITSSEEAHGIRYRLEDIFKIERTGEAERFAKSEYAKLKKHDRRLLWHGSRATNYGGILSQGLRIAPPEAPVSGYAFGKGIYMADISSKSAQYCASGMSGGTGLLLLVEAELGKPMYEIPTGDSGAEAEAKKRGCHSTLGVGRQAPQGWTDAQFINENLKGVQVPDVSKGYGDNKAASQTGYLMHNEYIAYSVNQLRIRYLFRVGM